MRINKIKEIRIARGITQKRLSELTGLSQQHISEIERGKKNPTLKTLNKILEALEYVED